MLDLTVEGLARRARFLLDLSERVVDAFHATHVGRFSYHRDALLVGPAGILLEQRASTFVHERLHVVGGRRVVVHLSHARS